jgi:plastocyanin
MQPIRAEEAAMKTLLLASSVVSLTALAVPGAAMPQYGYGYRAPMTTRVTTVHVTAKDFAFVLSRKTVPHGRVKFVIRNTAGDPHDFAIAGHKSKTITNGQTATLTVMLKRGRWPYKCTVDSHAQLGMKGMLRVT